MPDERVLQVLGVVRASGAASVCNSHGTAATHGGVEGLPTAMVLVAGEGLPMTVSSFTWTLHRGVNPRMRALLGAGDDVAYPVTRARVVRLLGKMVPWGDSSGRSGLDRALLNSVTDRLLGASWSAQPAEIREAWTGDVAFEGGSAEPVGGRTAAQGAGAATDVDAGWCMRLPDPEGGRSVRRWGYEVQLAVGVGASPGGWVPGAVVGLRLHRPARDRRPL